MPRPPRPSAAANIASHGDALSEWDRALVGPEGMQLRWKARDQIDLRRIAAILRDLANRYEVLSEPRRYPEREALIGARLARKQAQDRLAIPGGK